MTGTYLNTFLQLGALYAFVAFSVAVSFRFLSFPDLTVAGSFLLGAATSAQFIVHDIHWGIAMGAASVAGFFAGLTTATIHGLLGINKFFSGILAMMMLYSVNLRVLGGANLSIFEEATLFSALSGPDYVTTLFCLGLAFGGAIICLASFHTWFGLLLRGLGTRPSAPRLPGELTCFWA